MLLCCFNANNLYVRYKFGEAYPGDMSGKSAAGTHRDWGFLPHYQKGSFQIFNEGQRKLAAQAITRDFTVFPDVVCLQEVESLLALRTFNEEFFGENPWPYAVLIDSRDFRQIDVAVLSRYPVLSVRTHVDDKTDDGSGYVFSRDCLEVTVQPPKGKPVTLFVNHLKSQLAQGKTAAEKAADAQRSTEKRALQAKSIVEILRARFPGANYNGGLFAVLGDFNATPDAPELAALTQKAGLTSALDKLPSGARWTHYWKAKNSAAQLDHVLLSPALAQKMQGAPLIERRGLGYRETGADGGLLPKALNVETPEGSAKADFRFERFAAVAPDNAASDHCPIFVEFKL